jgi:flagellar assembly factor FliW
MMSIELLTNRFGYLNISENDIYTFSKGIPGFEEQTSFIIVAPEQDDPFSFLQSVAAGDLAFVITDPFLFYPDYEFEIPESALSELNIQSKEQVMVRSIITIPDKLEAATINLVAPIVLNVDGRLGKQVVLGKSPYTTKHSLFRAAEKP